MKALKISVLGSLRISAGERILNQFESNKARALLAYLAVEINFPHSRESLTELLWPESPLQSALWNLRFALADLRRVVGDGTANPPYLLIRRESLQFNASSNYELDVDTFTKLVQTGKIENLKQAAALYQGNFLAGFPPINSNPFEEWIILNCERCKRQVIDSLRLIAEHHEQRGEYEQALPFAYRQTELEPWMEESHKQLMRLLAFNGQRSAALAQFESCRRILARELDVEPSSETTRLYEAIRDGGLGVPRTPVLNEYDKVISPLIVKQSSLEELEVTIRVISDSLSAGRNAANRSSYEEAITHYRHGLDLLNSRPDSLEKLEYELQFQTALGAALLPIRNFSSSEVAQAYRRAYEICRQMGDRAELFHALKALSSYYVLCGDIHTGLDIGEKLMKIAEEDQDETKLIIAHNNLGINLLFAGEFVAYRHHMQKLLQLYNDNRHRQLTSLMGYDPKVATLSHSIGLWALGYPDQALVNVFRAVEWAEQIQHPFSKCYAQFFLAQTHLLRREVPAAQDKAEELISFSRQHCNSFWFAQGLIVKGWSIAQMGQAVEGLQLLLQGFSIVRGMGSNFVLCASAAWLGETCGLAGKAEEGLSVMDEYIPQSRDAGIMHMMSPNYQCRGELLLRLNKPEEAEDSFEKAIEIARQQAAKGWELRAALSLAHLYTRWNKSEAAHLCLREIAEWFTEGFGTLDLVEAKALLGGSKRALAG